MYIWILDIKVSVNTSYSRQAPGLVTRERTQSRLVTTLWYSTGVSPHSTGPESRARSDLLTHIRRYKLQDISLPVDTMPRSDQRWMTGSLCSDDSDDSNGQYLWHWLTWPSGRPRCPRGRLCSPRDWGRHTSENCHASWQETSWQQILTWSRWGRLEPGCASHSWGLSRGTCTWHVTWHVMMGQ